ncbi:gamma-glutamyltranspeptidase/glutathione hydrolase [Actinoalloteichus hoggarensis]|uniref:Glutathione hydrolase proenzyme n=1 Tax=Actinoalloteichus hoggarensis TaxID=1470176 RepID=A0A221W7Z5_9PSEU|nr:gamma-glutamyltransferase [Actinoalloteichus hoggarensis]ASO22038.1 Gamma-glutamyltranspeptidase precursor [Actinoalloteichus hoggarensis]MBB5923880.1 gamma-glutamyltranspeptidase/glutathione hydrolase [Actinoalloteichus hoggarensis]
MRLRRARRVLTIAAASVLLGSALAVVPPAAGDTSATRPPTAKRPVAVGDFGAVASVDADATAIGIGVLRGGGNAVDAAVATAAALGVTDPFSAGIGGGGFLMYYDAATGRVHTLDGRETAPAAVDENLFVEDGVPLPFSEAVTSGLSVGVPGTPATWRDALERWGTRSLASLLRPATRLAEDGFVVDSTFHDQIANNADRFTVFPATRDLFLPDGRPPEVGSTFRNPDLADTYRLLARTGTAALYRGEIGADLAETVRRPAVDPDADRIVRPGSMTVDDLADYRTVEREPTHVDYRGLDVYGMPAPSSGGLTVGLALNMLERFDLSDAAEVDYLHGYLEASRISFADRNRWIGDPAFVDVPAAEFAGQDFADSRSCLIDLANGHALTSPVAPGDPRDPRPCGTVGPPAPTPYEGESTTHLTVADRQGNVAAYTLTIEQEGGSGMVVPGRGFLLNNELTDFSFTPVTPGVPDPNLPDAGKRPRSSMTPTIVLADGEPLLALGSPGGTTIITTVLGVLLHRLDRGLSLPEAVAAPRASQRNAASAAVEQAFLDLPAVAELRDRGQGFATRPSSIGAVTGVERLPDGRWLAAAEPVRRGGGAAAVVRPRAGE